MGEAWRDFREGLPPLLLCNFGDYLAGYILHALRGVIANHPVLLALLPAASDARGNVYSSFGSRLGTLLHLGLARRYLVCELSSLAVILVAVNLWVGLAVSLTVSRNMPFPWLLTVSVTPLLAALISGLFMAPFVTILALKSFEKGLDPDNIVSPLSTLAGDLVTIPTLVAAYLLLSGNTLLAYAILALSCILALMGVYMGSRGACRSRFVKVLGENLGAILVSTMLSILAGILLLANAEKVLRLTGLLAVLPAFLQDGGVIACRFSARLSTMMHLGRVRLSLLPRDPWVLSQLLVNLGHAAIVFSLLGLFGSVITGFNGGYTMLLIVLLAGLALTVSVSVLAYYTALASFTLGLDPDNILAPLLTSIADLLGVAYLTYFAGLLASHNVSIKGVLP